MLPDLWWGEAPALPSELPAPKMISTAGVGRPTRPPSRLPRVCAAYKTNSHSGIEPRQASRPKTDHRPSDIGLREVYKVIRDPGPTILAIGYRLSIMRVALPRRFDRASQRLQLLRA
jgi:hypothetical protein